MEHITHRVYAGANKPLQYWGIDRRLFIADWIVVFIFYGLVRVPIGPVIGAVMFVAIWRTAKYLTGKDQNFLDLWNACLQPAHWPVIRLWVAAMIFCLAYEAAGFFGMIVFALAAILLWRTFRHQRWMGKIADWFFPYQPKLLRRRLVAD